MRMRRVFVSWSLACGLLLLAFLPLRAETALNFFPDPPATYYGQVAASADFTPTVGMSVIAWISETLCGQSETQALGADVIYVIHVQSDWSMAPGCGAPGRDIRFKVDGILMQPLTIWDNSQVHELNLSPALSDAVPPTVVSVSPVNGATDVVRNVPLVIDFSEPMQTGSVTVSIVPAVTGLVKAWGLFDTRLTLNHNAFAASTRYTVTVTGSDLVGNPMTVPYMWTFTTGAEIAPEADLALHKARVGSGVVAAGDAITYTFPITNHGPSGPVTATVVDVFSDATALAEVSGPGCVWLGAEMVTCSATGVMTLTPSILTLVVTTNELYSGTLYNEAMVTLDGEAIDPNASNNHTGPVTVVIQTEEIGRDRKIYLPLILRGS